MAGSVLDDRLQALRLAEGLEDSVGDLLDRRFFAAADVIGLAEPPALDDSVDRGAVVVDVQPLALVLGRGVQR